MPNAMDLDITADSLKVFLAGDAGTGKSTFAASFPQPIRLFDFDKGVRSYMGVDCDYDQFDLSSRSWTQFEKLATEFIQKVDTNDQPAYKTLVVDSCTTWADLAMEQALNLNPQRSVTGGAVWNVHYGIVKDLVEGWTRRLLRFKGNIVFIGHTSTTKDDVTGLIKVGPLLTGQLSVKVPGLFDEVYYTSTKMQDGKVRYLCQTEALGYYNARSRLSGKEHRLPLYVSNDYQTIMNLVKEKVK